MAFEIVKDVLHIATFTGAIAMPMCEIVSKEFSPKCEEEENDE